MAKSSKATKVAFTPRERSIIQQYALAVWNECAYDCLAAVAEEDGRDTVTREEAMEIALDAGRMEERMRLAQRRGNKSITDDLMARIARADYETLIAAAKPAFGFARYGL